MVTSIKFSTDGSKIAIGTGSNTTHIYWVENGQVRGSGPRMPYQKDTDSESYDYRKAFLSDLLDVMHQQCIYYDQYSATLKVPQDRAGYWIGKKGCHIKLLSKLVGRRVVLETDYFIGQWNEAWCVYPEMKEAAENFGGICCGYHGVANQMYLIPLKHREEWRKLMREAD